MPARPQSLPADLVTRTLSWFRRVERPLPWRGAGPWGVLVSEFMLQQTPVNRVLPVWPGWMERWPTPTALAAASPADAIRAWGRLGYPRRAQRLRAAAVMIRDAHSGQVPREAAALRALPGVGEYTAAAVQSFAFGRRALVLDTNVRRVLARSIDGIDDRPAHLTNSEREQADLVWPASDARAARWSAAVMELGALVCTARNPACGSCPIQSLCAWTAVGKPSTQRRRVQPAFHGSDRQARGRIMALLRDQEGPVTKTTVLTTSDDEQQVERALQGLLADGLVVTMGRRYALPGS